MKTSCSRACRVVILHKGSLFSVGLSQEHPCPFLWARLEEIPRGSSVGLRSSLGLRALGQRIVLQGSWGVSSHTTLRDASSMSPAWIHLTTGEMCDPILSFPPHHQCWCHWRVGHGKEGSGPPLHLLIPSIFHPAFLSPGSRYLDLRYFIYVPTLIMEASGSWRMRDFYVIN